MEQSIAELGPNPIGTYIEVDRALNRLHEAGYILGEGIVNVKSVTSNGEHSLLSNNLRE